MLSASMTVTPERFEALTFDCYGTLVDWDRGIVRDLRAALPDVTATDGQLLDRYATAEAQAERPPFRSYRNVLRDVLEQLGRDFGITPRSPDALVSGLPSWPVFDDTRAALATLQKRFRLCIVSNVDRDLFTETEAQLGVRFDEVVTADQVGSYKPGPAHLVEACRRLGLARDQVLHVGQSQRHDVQMAQGLGMAAAWVDRPGGRASGAPVPGLVPDLRVDSLAALARTLCPGQKD
jgi:2-haloacid dehalogenase